MNANAENPPKDWAEKQVLEPLTEPAPAAQDGPAGTHFGNTMANVSDKRSAAQIEMDKKGLKVGNEHIKDEKASK